MAAAADLASLELFTGVDDDSLGALAATLALQEHAPGEVLVREGDDGSSFLIVLEGRLKVTRQDPRGQPQEIATVGPGSILGELVMLTGRPRMATAAAETRVRVAVGDADAFDLLVHLPVAQDRVAEVVAHRLAEAARSVPVTLRDGSELHLRPLLPQDRAELVDVIGRQTPEWLRYRFFTPGRPSARTIDHLVNINYIDHFAWVARGADSHRGLAIGRYVRLRDEPHVADVSFGVTGEHQGRGLATLLLGAVAATAGMAGITELVAEVLHDNAPMRSVFDKVEGRRWSLVEPGVGAVRMDVAAARSLVDDRLAAALVRTAREIVTGAGLALARRTGP